MSRHVLCVIDNLGSGGAQRQLVALAHGLARTGHRAAIATYTPGTGLFEGDVGVYGTPHHNVGRGLGHPVGTALAIRRLVRREGFDVVIAFLPAPSLVASLALLGVRGVRLIVSERSSFPRGRPSPADRLVRVLHRRADWITANSFHQTELMRRAFPVVASRLRVIYNGYDVDRFRVSRGPRADGKIRLVAVGRVTQGKNVPNLVEAVRRARSEGLDVSIDWIGRLDDERWSSGHYHEVARCIDAAQLGRAWRWLGEVNDVQQRLADYDGLVHPSHYEGLPNAVCEAFASGVPVLASAVCDHPRLLGAPERGLLFDPEDPASIARAIGTFCFLPSERRAAMGVAARRFAVGQLSLQRMTAQYAELFAERRPIGGG